MSAVLNQRRSKIRNWHVQALQPGVAVSLPIDPPIAEHERPYVVSGLGPGSVVVRSMDNHRVVIENPTTWVVPFLFCVGPSQILPPALSKLAKILIGQ
jgi:hypothetical protein